MPVGADGGAREGVFLNPAMSRLLETVRGLAALVVLVGHAAQRGVYTGPWPLGDLVQHSAVVVFFVLSGVVIQASAMRPGQTLAAFAAARASRVLPVAAVAIAVAVAAELAVGGEVSARSVLLAATFLSEHWSDTNPAWNPPWWSFAYEVWFYALFAAATFLAGVRRWLALAALAWLAGPLVLALLPVWLIGVALARSGAPRLSRCAAWTMLAAGAAGFVGMLAERWPNRARDLVGTLGLDPASLRFSSYALADFVLAVCVAAVFLSLRRLVADHPRLADRGTSLRRVAGFSFTLYVLHWPVLTLMRAAGWSAGIEPALVVLLLVPVLVACVVARWTEGRWRIALRRRLDGSASHDPAAPAPIPA